MARSFLAPVSSLSNPREVWLITGAHGVNEFYSVALPPVLPLLLNEFAITYQEAGLLLTVFYATYSVFQLPAGVLADRIGQRRLLPAGMLVLSGGILLAAGADNYWTLVGAEVLAGIGGSTYHPSGMSLISDMQVGDAEGTAMGIHGFGGVVGTALAPALIGGLAVLYDWRLALTACTVVGIGYAFVFVVLFPDVDPPPAGTTVGTGDVGGRGGSVQSAVGTSLREWWSRGSLSSVPQTRWVGILFLVNLVTATVTGATRTFTSSYLVDFAGMTTGVANGVFFVMLVGAGVASLTGGVLADLVERCTLGFVLMVVSAVMLTATSFVPSIPLVLFAWFFVLGTVLWAVIPLVNAVASQYSEQEFSGSLFGVLLTAASLGGAVGPLLFGIVANRFGLAAAFPAVAGVTGIGAMAFLALKRL